MRSLLVCLALVATLAQPAEPVGAAAVMESLLFGFAMAPAVRTAGLADDAARSLESYRQRESLFKSTIPPPARLEGPEGSLYSKRAGIERALFCLLDRADSLQIAGEYARQITLLSEWEGFADSPLTEAASADEYLAQHPGSPAAPYAQLFAGHRKLCAITEMAGLDRSSGRALAIARAADAQLAAARNSGHPLLRIVAGYLLASRRCLER